MQVVVVVLLIPQQEQAAQAVVVQEVFTVHLQEFREQSIPVAEAAVDQMDHFQHQVQAVQVLLFLKYPIPTLEHYRVD